MLTTTSTFDQYHENAERAPAYLVHFENEELDYASSDAIENTDNRIMSLIQKISGNSQTIRPEEGKSSIGQVTVSLLDEGNQVTNLIVNDTNQLHRKKTTVKAGYVGMNESDMVTIFTGWVTGIKQWPDTLGYDISITDPLRWLSRKIFRGSEDTPVTFVGNPIDVMLWVMCSTGNGTNGSYDVLAEANALGIDESYLQIEHIEEERDKWFHGVRFSFDIRKRITAKNFLETEIWKPCNIYPIIKGNGMFDIRVFRPPLPTGAEQVQSLNESDIIGFPQWDQNLEGLINEIEFHYDYDAAAEEYGSQTFYADGTSINARGPGKSSIEIKSRGIQTSIGGEEFITRRKNRVFQRYSNPPPAKIQVKTLFGKWLSEAGDVIPITHSRIPNLYDATMGITQHLMEIIDRSVDWQNGLCNFTLLDTGWTGNRYGVISPASAVLNGTNQRVFTLASGEGSKWQSGWHIDLFRKNMILVKSNLTIARINGDEITVTSNIGWTPQLDWIITFSTYDNCTVEQKQYAFIADSNQEVGTENDSAFLIC